MNPTCKNCGTDLKGDEREHGFCSRCDARPADKTPAPPFVSFFYMTQNSDERLFNGSGFAEAPRVFLVTVQITAKNKHAYIEVRALCGEGVAPLKSSNQLANAAFTEVMRKLSNAGVEINSVGVEIK